MDLFLWPHSQKAGKVGSQGTIDSGDPWDSQKGTWETWEVSARWILELAETWVWVVSNLEGMAFSW